MVNIWIAILILLGIQLLIILGIYIWKLIKTNEQLEEMVLNLKNQLSYMNGLIDNVHDYLDENYHLDENLKYLKDKLNELKNEK